MKLLLLVLLSLCCGGCAAAAVGTAMGLAESTAAAVEKSNANQSKNQSTIKVVNQAEQVEQGKVGPATVQSQTVSGEMVSVNGVHMTISQPPPGPYHLVAIGNGMYVSSAAVGRTVSGLPARPETPGIQGVQNMSIALPANETPAQDGWYTTDAKGHVVSVGTATSPQIQTANMPANITGSK